MQLSFEPRRPMMLCKVASCCERLNICRACVPGSLDQQIQVVCGIIHLLNWKCHVKNKLTVCNYYSENNKIIISSESGHVIVMF